LEVLNNSEKLPLTREEFANLLLKFTNKGSYPVDWRKKEFWLDFYLNAASFDFQLPFTEDFILEKFEADGKLKECPLLLNTEQAKYHSNLPYLLFSKMSRIPESVNLKGQKNNLWQELTEDFSGRQEEMEDVWSLAQKNGNIVVLAGPGIGKSALIANLALRINNSVDVIYYCCGKKKLKGRKLNVSLLKSSFN